MTSIRLVIVTFSLATVALPAGCAEGAEQLVIDFELRNGDAKVGCGDPLLALGTAATAAELVDARFFVSDVRLVDAEGAEIPLVLDDVPGWQSRGVALVDFADDTASCVSGNPATRARVVGRTEGAEDAVGLRFTVGVPEARNHIEADKAEAPFDEPGMFWSWVGGFKFVKIEVATAQHPAWLVHVGSTGCSGSPSDGYACSASNRAHVALDFIPREDAVALDLAALFAGADLNEVPDELVDPIPGCMSSATDAQCASLFAALGLANGAPVAPATVFKTVASARASAHDER